jgi:hypothetical protein
MRLRFLLALILAITTATIVALPARAADPGGYRAFSSTRYHFRMDYPASWSAVVTPTGPIFAVSSTAHKGPFVNVVTVSAKNAPGLDVWAAVAVKLARHDAPAVIGPKKTHVAGYDARLITASGSHKRYAVVLFKGHSGWAWQIAVQSSPVDWSHTWSTFQKMLGTFKEIS